MRKKKGFSGTDDASLVEACGVPIVVLNGDERNLKVTTPDDIPVLEFYLNGPTKHCVGSAMTYTVL